MASRRRRKSASGPRQLAWRQAFLEARTSCACTMWRKWSRFRESATASWAPYANDAGDARTISASQTGNPQLQFLHRNIGNKNVHPLVHADRHRVKPPVWRTDFLFVSFQIDCLGRASGL